MRVSDIVFVCACCDLCCKPDDYQGFKQGLAVNLGHVLRKTFKNKITTNSF